MNFQEIKALIEHGEDVPKEVYNSLTNEEKKEVNFLISCQGAIRLSLSMGKKK